MHNDPIRLAAHSVHWPPLLACVTVLISNNSDLLKAVPLEVVFSPRGREKRTSGGGTELTQDLYPVISTRAGAISIIAPEDYSHSQRPTLAKQTQAIITQIPIRWWDGMLREAF